jgi:hypothetical protein
MPSLRRAVLLLQLSVLPLAHLLLEARPGCAGCSVNRRRLAGRGSRLSPRIPLPAYSGAELVSCASFSELPAAYPITAQPPGFWISENLSPQCPGSPWPLHKCVDSSLASLDKPPA